MKNSRLVISGDEEDLSSGNTIDNGSLSRSSHGTFLTAIAVFLALMVGAAATVGYYNNFVSNTSRNVAVDRRGNSLKKNSVEKRSLQQFGHDSESPRITTIVMTEDSVSDTDVHELLYEGSETSEDTTLANEEPIVEVDSVIMNMTEHAVMVDQAATASRRNALLVKQALVQSGEQLKILYMNTIDVQPGDFIALTPFSADVSAGLSSDDYIAYAYVCPPGSDPTFDCPRYGTVLWDVEATIPSGRYMVYLSKEDNPEPYTIKAETSRPFMIQGANRAEVAESPTPAPPTIPPPIENPIRSLDTIMNGGIRNNGIIFEVDAKRTIRITSIAIHTPLKEAIPITVYAMSGSAAGKERDASQWSKIASGKVFGKGDGLKTNIPVSLVIQAGRRIAFYCDTPSVFIPGPIRYSPSNIPTGGVFSEDDNIDIIVGYGLDPFFGESYPNRIFNGGVNYEVV